MEMATEVLKLSNSQLFFNKRFLALKNGELSYFSNVQKLTRPKETVRVIDCEIKRADNDFCKKKKKPWMFVVSYMKGKKTHSWCFATESEELLEQWLEYLLKAKYTLPEIEQPPEEKKQRSAEEDFNRRAELEKRKARLREKEQEELRKQQAIEEEIKKLKEREEEKRREEENRQKQKKYEALLEHSWDYQFQRYWSQIIASANDYSQNLLSGIKMFKHIGSFKVQAVEASKRIIDEIYMPIAHRKIKPLDDPAIPTYIYRNMILRLTWDQDNSSIWKLFGHEFRAADMTVDALFLLSKRDPAFKLRVPLNALVDYKGFRMHVMALCPLDGDLTLIHGPKTDGVYTVNPAIYPHLSWLASVLNLKEHKFEWTEKMAPSYVHLSVFTQLHNSLGYSNLEEYVRMKIDKSPEEVTASDHIYMLKFSDLLPIDIDIHSDTPEFSQRLRPEFLCDLEYPLSSDSFLNLDQSDDLEVAEAGRFLRNSKLKEMLEILDSLSVMPIDSKSMTQALHSQGINMRYLGYIAENTILPHIKEIACVEILGRTCKRILNRHIAELLLEPTDQEIIPEEAYDDYIEAVQAFRTKTFESNYADPSIKDLKLAASSSYQDTFVFRKRAFTKKLTMALQVPLQETVEGVHYTDPITPRAHVRVDTSVKECVVDFLNLVFGVGEEHSEFWEEILVKKASISFNVSTGFLAKHQINLHALLHSICYHCGLDLSFYKDTDLGTSEAPFSVSHLEKVMPKDKIYSLKNVEYKILADEYSKFRESNDKILSIETASLKLKVSKALNPQADYLGDPNILADIAEILLESNKIDKAIKRAKEALVQIHPLHAESVKSWCVLLRALMMKNMQQEALQCFDNALGALDFHWGPYHPLHSTIYSILAYHYMQLENYDDALILYKNSLMCCLKVLGPNHPHTAEVYLELGNLYMKANSYGDAMTAYEKARSIYVASLGENELITASASIQLANLLVLQENFEKAYPLIAKSLIVHEYALEELLQNNDAEDAPKIASHYNKISEILALGLTVSASLHNDQAVLSYCEKMFEHLFARNEDSDRDIVKKVLKMGIIAKLNVIEHEDKNCLISAYMNDIEEGDYVKINKRFVKYLKAKGGLNAFLDGLFYDIVVLARKIGGKTADEIIRLKNCLCELRGIANALEIDLVES